MALKSEISSLEEAPEALREHYEEIDGRWVLSVDGAVPKKKLDEFRDNNRKLHRELEAAKKKLDDFEGLDPVEYRKLQKRVQEIEEKKMLDDGQIDELVNKRTERALKAAEDQMKAKDSALSERTRELERISAELSEIKIFSQIKDIAIGSGAHEQALADIARRGREIWRLEDGKPVPKDGDSPIYGANGDVMTMKEWVEGLQKEAPYFFKESTGSGAQNRPSTGPAKAGRISRSELSDSRIDLEKIASGEVEVTD